MLTRVLDRVADAAVSRRRRRRRIVVAAVVVAALFGVGVAGLGGLSANGGSSDPGQPSSRAAAVLADRLHVPATQLIVVVETRQPGRGSIDTRAATAAGRSFAQQARGQIRQVVGAGPPDTVADFWTSADPGLRAPDGSSALLTAALSADATVAATQAAALTPQLVADGRAAGLTVLVGGGAVVGNQIGAAVEHGLVRAEAVSLPITLLLLVLLFGSVTAAMLPLAVGAAGVAGGFFGLSVLGHWLTVSSYGTNLALSLGFGLGIDYGLFIVTRYREQVARGDPPTTAARVAVQTAGRTVLFSALTVAIALAALLVFPIGFLRSFGYAGVAATVSAAAAALLLLPALLVALAGRLDRGDLRRPLRRLLHLPPPKPPVPDAENGLWHRVAVAVMRRPILAGAAALAVAFVLSAPLPGARFGNPDDRVLPASTSSSQVGNILRADYVSGTDPVQVVSAAATAEQRAAPAAAAYAAALSRVPDVHAVDAATGSWAAGRRLRASAEAEAAYTAAPAGTWLQVSLDVDSSGAAGLRAVRAIRAVPSPLPHVVVGGAGAQLLDTRSAIAGRLPAAGLLVGLTTLLVLFAFTRSVLLPVKALVLTGLSVAATLGAAVWGFQHGHLAGLLGFQQTGMLDIGIPVLLFCVLFGLSMDYEVFLLSRITEEHRAGRDTEQAVALGLGATGPLISAAAAILAVVFVALVSSDVTFIKLLGLGSALAVLLDATIVRGVLLPAIMRLAGPANWWAPSLRRRAGGRHRR